MSEEADVKIGVSLDTRQLPEQVRRAEEEVKGAVEGATEAIEAQGAAADVTAGKLEVASSRAAALQRIEAAGMRRMVGECAREQKKLANGTREGMRLLGKQVSASMKSAAGEITAAMKQAADASAAAGKQVSADMKGAAGATGGLTTALGVAKGAMDVLTRGFAIIGLFNQVVATVKMVMEWWRELQKETVSAGQKVANQWKLARMEAENTARMRAPHESLEEQIELNERLMERLRERNAFEAEMAQMKAEREGNRRGVQQAILDGQLARGEISSREHLEGFRRLEDAEREEAQGMRMQELTTAADTARMKFENKAAEHDAVQRNLDALGGKAQVLRLGDAGYWEGLAAKWADANEVVTGYAGPNIFNSGNQNVLERRAYEQALKERAALRSEILAGAQAMGVTPSNEEEGKLVDRNMAEVAAAVMKTYQEKLAETMKEEQLRREKMDEAADEAKMAQARVDELERSQEEEDRGVLQRRAQEDATLAHRADEAADKAEVTAEAARAEQARREERGRLAAGMEKAEAERKEAQRLMDDALLMLKERATEEQQPAVAALEALLERANLEPEVAGQLEALMTNGKLSVTDDQSRRYGKLLQLVGAGGLDKDAVLDVLNWRGHVNYHQNAVDEYAGELDAMNRQEAAAAEEQRRQRVRDQEEGARAARQHAEAEAEAARRSRAASGADPLEGLDGALGAGTEAMNAQGAVGDAAVAAMGAFNSTATALVGTAAAQAGQIEALRAGQVGLQQQISNINRTSIC